MGWEQYDLGLSVPPFIESTADSLLSVVETIDTVLTLLLDVLNVVKIFYSGAVDPFAVLIVAFIEALEDFVKDLFGTGVYVLAITPYYKEGGLKEQTLKILDEVKEGISSNWNTFAEDTGQYKVDIAQINAQIELILQLKTKVEEELLGNEKSQNVPKKADFLHKAPVTIIDSMQSLVVLTSDLKILELKKREAKVNIERSYSNTDYRSGLTYRSKLTIELDKIKQDITTKKTEISNLIFQIKSERGNLVTDLNSLSVGGFPSTRESQSGSSSIRETEESIFPKYDENNIPTLTPVEAINLAIESFDDEGDVRRPPFSKASTVTGFGILITTPYLQLFATLLKGATTFISAGWHLDAAIEKIGKKAELSVDKLSLAVLEEEARTAKDLKDFREKISKSIKDILHAKPEITQASTPPDWDSFVIRDLEKSLPVLERLLLNWLNLLKAIVVNASDALGDLIKVIEQKLKALQDIIQEIKDFLLKVKSTQPASVYFMVFEPSPGGNDFVKEQIKATPELKALSSGEGTFVSKYTAMFLGLVGMPSLEKYPGADEYEEVREGWDIMIEEGSKAVKSMGVLLEMV